MTPVVVGTMINTATVAASVGNDPVLSNNTASVTTAVAGLEIVVNPSSPSTDLVFNDGQGNQTTVTVPADAVDRQIKLVFTPVTPSVGAPAGSAFAGHGFILEAFEDPGGTPLPNYSFNPPLEVTINYSNSDIANVNDESALTLYYWSGTAWVDVATTCTPASTYQRNLAANTISVEICHLTEFALFGPTDTVSTYLPIILKGSP